MSVPKEKSDYTAEDISSIAKDAKVRHLLHSAIDNVMSNRVINCKTAKEIWDALEIRCQGTDSIKKNRKTILTQEYEHFVGFLTQRGMAKHFYTHKIQIKAYRS